MTYYCEVARKQTPEEKQRAEAAEAERRSKEADRRESERKQLRAELRLLDTQYRITNTSIEVIQDCIRGISSECDRLAAEHEAACGPLQSELRELLQKLIDAEVEGKPAKKLEQRRAEVQIRLAELNAAFERALVDAKIPLPRLYRELELAKQHRQGRPISDGEYFRCARPALRDWFKVCEDALALAVRRIEIAKARLARSPASDVFAQEVSDAQAARVEAQSKMDQAWREAVESNE